MATKTQRVRRIAAIAIGAVKGIFRTGRAWGTARTRVATARRPATGVTTGAALAAGVAGGAAGAYFLDPSNGQRRRRALGRRVPPVRWVASVFGRGSSKEEAEEPVDSQTADMAVGNGAGNPARAKEVAASSS